MKNRIKAIIATAIAVPALAAVAVLPGSGHGMSSASSAPSVAHAQLMDFTGQSFEQDNIKIEGFDHGCLTFAHPVAGSAIGTAPCNGGHNWNWIISPDGSQEVFEANGTSLVLGDSGGHIVLVPFNKTSASLHIGTLVLDGNGMSFRETAFSEALSVGVMATGITGNVVPGAVNVHSAWQPLGHQP